MSKPARQITVHEAHELFPLAAAAWPEAEPPKVWWTDDDGALAADSADDVPWFWDPMTGWDPL